jgi:hypothetical protein
MTNKVTIKDIIKYVIIDLLNYIVMNPHAIAFIAVFIVPIIIMLYIAINATDSTESETTREIDLNTSTFLRPMSQNKASLEEVVNHLRNGNTPKLWKIDKMELPDGRTVTVLVGRVKMISRDMTFPAVVIRVTNAEYVRDYTIGLGAMRLLMNWLDMGSEQRVKLLKEVIEKAGPTSRTQDAEVESL